MWSNERDGRNIGVLWCFAHVETKENDKTVKRVYVVECAGRPSKKWIDIVKDGLKKKEWCMIGVNSGGLLGGMLGV